MRDMQGERRAERPVDVAAHPRKTVVDLIEGYLREERAEADQRPHFEFISRSQRLHRQPWRHPRRPNFAPPSVMEIIRRYEASHGLN